MKTLQKNLARALMALSLVTAATVGASDNKVPSPSFAVLSKATQIELPSKAAELVLKADAKHCEQTTIDVVKAAVGLNPAAAPTVVASIAHTSPEMAAIAAATAAALVPNSAAEIARVAAVAAPKKSGQIVAAICRVFPKRYKEIASAVAEAVPTEGKQILAGVTSAIPMLATPINKIMLAYNGNNVPAVPSVLDQVPSSFVPSSTPTASPTSTSTAPESTTGSAIIAPPTFGAPYVIPPGSHGGLDPGAGTTVPTGGRNYASP